VQIVSCFVKNTALPSMNQEAQEVVIHEAARIQLLSHMTGS
jgi:hypothetical protein